MIKLDDIKIYKALIKANAIGKSLGNKSMYNFTSGMMLHHHFKPKEEAYSEFDNCVNIAFLHDKIMDELGDLLYIPLNIYGDELARMDKEYGKCFNHIEVTKDNLTIFYNIEVNESPDDIMTEFIKEFSVNHPDYELTQASFTTDIMVLQEYKKFIVLYKPVKKAIEYEYKIPVILEGSKTINRCNKYIEESLSFTTDNVKSMEFDNNIMKDIMSSNRPKLVKFDFGDIGVYEIRLMKSRFPGYNAKTIVTEIKVRPVINDVFQNIIVIRQKDVTICSVSKGVMY